MRTLWNLVRRNRAALLAAAALALSPIGAASGDTRSEASPGDDAALTRICENGIALALLGDAARAESVFVSLLSRSPGDPRALVNLGNLSLIQGKLGVALAFYDRALRRDTADAGIRLNRALVFTFEDDTAQARHEAQAAVALAGGADSAAELLGLGPATTDKAGEISSLGQHPWTGKRTRVSSAEIRALLEASDRSPRRAERSRRAAAAPGSAMQPSAAPEVRPQRLSTKAAETTGIATLLYWKDEWPGPR